ncbi:pyridoxamine 5'-phosphate oxidase family protein [Streptoalloteichus hindustanus]|uniref:Pyridoxamine 5'-phosphate oxidase N-terminal domain-containing protein n=1 Tax=Streptoalloteichus hindustanus TaxID=2017 RepID=A0A1M4UQT1_STRHI|nr:pyridoxamine 5'-phosphate oxidase family protein [Streptoalloteichus hindustanus]SHE59086.1 hypothetical protein SAMN05444320_101515 [Streptoalloteichus hindustanus]
MTPDTLVPTGVASPELLDLELAEGAPRVPPAPVVPTPVISTPVVSAPTTSPPDGGSADGASTPLPDPLRDMQHGMPGSQGEHLLQCAYGTQDRARRFYTQQVLDRLNPTMVEFIGRMDMAFVATSDSQGECDASLRCGPRGFVQVIDERHLAYPEYRGNGVLASLGNISENPHVGILMVDFVTDLIGLHVNGRARIMEDADLRGAYPELPDDFERGRTPERWVVVEVEEAYIHCRKHIPRMVPVVRNRPWGTDDTRRKGGDYFNAKAETRPWDSPVAADQPVGSQL